MDGWAQRSCSPLQPRHSREARADGARSRVAVVRSSSSDRVLREADTRLRAELLDAGFEVVEVDRAPGDSRSEVEDAAPTRRALPRSR